MAIYTFNHERARAAGLDVNAGRSYPPEMWDISFEGCVLGTYERNGYDDSDFFATVWDEAAQKVDAVMYATTRGWTYLDGARVDATDEVKAKANAWRRARERGIVECKARYELSRPSVGRKVRVARGKKVPVGTEGVVLTVTTRHNPYAPVPRWRNNAWSTAEVWLLVDTGREAVSVKAGYCDLIPDPELVEHRIAEELGEFDARPITQYYR